ncbi:UNVERIFIED_CONTAM: hypothetical protein Sradi_7208000 [Sesamum radiatum]|uniref:Reverse transcriptase domain-containing protein n=1 Tax=Sesamum radiatum TaxID=300843 RepID=A0AAW2IRI2_SESRA
MNVKLAAGFLEIAQKLLQTDRHNSLLLQLENCCRLVYLKATQLEHVMLRQRAKLQWLKGGDQCSKIPPSLKCLCDLFPRSVGWGSNREGLDLHYLRPWARHILTEEEAYALIRPVTVDDVKKAMFDIEEDKAPGPDGFSSVADFRPISCCNVVYKVISKILVCRFREILDLLISPSQNAFVPGRLISDNVLLAQELFSGYNQCRLPPRCALKVDLRKAYDTVEWDFLFATLRCLAFRLSLSVLQMILQQFIDQDGQFLYHWRCTELKLFQLSFADDLLLLCKADVQSVPPPVATRKWLGRLFADQLRKAAKVSKALMMSKHLGSHQAGSERALQFWGCAKKLDWGSHSDMLPGSTLFNLDSKDNKGACWRKMLTLRHTLLSHIHFRIGDGTSFLLWHDPWHTLGPLISQFPRGPQMTNIEPLDKLSVVIKDGQWNWPLITDIACLEITHMLPPITEGQDRISWKSNNGSFNTSTAYDLFRPPGPKVVWSSLLLGPFKIPKNCFILWLAILGRLSTLDKPWLTTQKITAFYVRMESKRHTITFSLHAPFPADVLPIRQQIPFLWPHRNWQRGIHWASSRWRGKHVVNAAFRSLLASLVYHIWQERNSRRFQQRSRTPSIVGNLVVEELRQRIISVQLRQSVSTLGLYRLWKIPWPVEVFSN